MPRRTLPLVVAVLGTAPTTPALAAVPFPNARCPGGIDVHADAGGPVYVQGRQTTLKHVNDRYAEARDAQSGLTVSISTGDDGTPQVSYTGRNGVNGICQVSDSAAAPPPSPAHRHDTDGDAALPNEVTCESTDQRSDNAKQNRDDDSARIASGHHELRQRPADQAE